MTFSERLFEMLLELGSHFLQQSIDSELASALQYCKRVPGAGNMSIKYEHRQNRLTGLDQIC